MAWSVREGDCDRTVAVGVGPWGRRPAAAGVRRLHECTPGSGAPGYHQARLNTDRKLNNHIRQIQALGFAVTITKAA
jgi:hypothetical protein